MVQTAKWKPTTFLRFEDALDTSMGTARIVTDAGPCYIKALGNRQGPHPLACEWVGTHLAGWFGLPTFDFAVMMIDADFDEIPFLRGGHAASGTAFVTRAMAGHTWGGAANELINVVNSEAISRLVVFDTWVLNCDRHPPDLNARNPNYDNVFLANVSEGKAGDLRLIAMDHTHCFSCGRDLDSKIADIGRVKDDRLYGLFPAFKARIRQEAVEEAIARLEQLNRADVEKIVESIPPDWEVPDAARRKLIDLIVARASFVAETIMPAFHQTCWSGLLFDLG